MNFLGKWKEQSEAAIAKATAVQLAQGSWSSVAWAIPNARRTRIAHNLRCFRKEWRHISTADVVQFMYNQRFMPFTRAIPR